MKSTGNRQWQPYLLAGALALSAILNLLLIIKVKNEQRLIADIKQQNRLQSGQKVPDIAGKTVEGDATEVNFSASNKPTILYVFTPACVWCKRNFENVAALHRNIADRYNFVGVSLTDKDLASYVKAHSIEYPVVTGLSDGTKAIYRMGGTPTTIVVSPENKVLKAWTGVYNGTQEAEISSYFHVKMPGLVREN